MPKLKEIQDAYAKEIGHVDWRHHIYHFHLSEVDVDKISKRYAQAALDEASENAKTIDEMQKCESCDGKGYLNLSDYTSTCIECHGSAVFMEIKVDKSSITAVLE